MQTGVSLGVSNVTYECTGSEGNERPETHDSDDPVRMTAVGTKNMHWHDRHDCGSRSSSQMLCRWLHVDIFEL